MLNIETIEVNFTEDNIESNVVIFQDGSVVIDQQAGDSAVVLSLEAIDFFQMLASNLVDYTDEGINEGLTYNYETEGIEDLNDDPYEGIDGENEDSGFNS